MICGYLFHANEQVNDSGVADSPGSSLFAKVLLCTVSVVKANRVRNGAATSRAQREVSVSAAKNAPFWQIDLLPFCLIAAGVYF